MVGVCGQEVKFEICVLKERNVQMSNIVPSLVISNSMCEIIKVVK